MTTREEWLAGAEQRRAEPLREDRPEDVRARLDILRGRHAVVAAVHLLLADDAGRLLMLRRFNTGYEDGNWSVPAGHLDGGEPVTAAMAREAREEIGVDLDPAGLTVVHVMHRAPAGSGGERVDFFLRARRWTGVPVSREPGKCDRLDWWPAGDLPENTVPYVRAAIEAAVCRVPFSEFGWRDQQE